MKQIKMHLIREAVIRKAGLEFKPRTHYHSLPMNLRAEVVVKGIDGTDTLYEVRVLSSIDAKLMSKTKARRPQRIQIWCVHCKEWVFAGKYMQHSRYKGHKV